MPSEFDDGPVEEGNQIGFGALIWRIGWSEFIKHLASHGILELFHFAFKMCANRCGSNLELCRKASEG